MWSIRGLILLTVSVIVVGCASPQTLPIAARSGDTITLALGSHEGMKIGNTTVAFTPDSNGIPVALTAKAIFNLYPDKRSQAFLDSSTVASGTYHEPWLTVMVIDLPEGLPTGFGTIKVNTTVPQPNGPNARVEDVDYRLEILPGTGAPHNLQYQLSSFSLNGNLRTLRPIPNQAYIVPPSATCPQSSNYAAIELRFRLPYVIEPWRDVEWFRVVADDFTALTYEKTPQVTWAAQGDDLVVVFMSADGMLKCYEPKFSLVPTDASFSDLGPPVLLSVTYYDVNGAIITGPQASEYQVSVQ